MLILLEGPDGGGKSTLAALLAEHTNGRVEVRHCGPLERSPEDEYMRDLMSYTPGSGDTIIYDRHYLGELIYGPLYRNESKITGANRWLIESFLNQKGAVLVHVTNKVEVLRDRLKKRGETFLRDEHLEEVVTAFSREYSQALIISKTTVVDPNLTDARHILMFAKRVEDTVGDNT